MNMAEGRGAYLALPRKVIFGLSASVQWDQEVCTRVTVCQRETSIRHFLPGGSCIESVVSVNITVWSDDN